MQGGLSPETRSAPGKRERNAPAGVRSDVLLLCESCGRIQQADGSWRYPLRSLAGSMVVRTYCADDRGAD